MNPRDWPTCVACDITYDPNVRSAICPHDWLKPASTEVTPVTKCTCSDDQVLRTMEGCTCGGE